jgi:hypothetical protein
MYEDGDVIGDSRGPALDAEGEAGFLATACGPVPEGCGCCAGG